jgi:TrmH family RNA methyltransferase
MSDSEIITSRDNAKLKFARSVRDGRETGLIFIEGVRLVQEALRSDLSIRSAFVSVAFSLGLAESLNNTRVEVITVAEKAFASIADTENSQGIVLIAERPTPSLDDVRGEGPVVLLHQVNNPSNLGAVVRTAEAAGCAGLITTNGSADAFSPKALRASMGSAFRLPVVERIGFGDAIEWVRSNGLVTTAADVSGTLNYAEVDWTIPRLLVFGSEAHGLSERELESINEKVVIPMENEVESLNLAVSSGIVLFEAKRQRDLS